MQTNILIISREPILKKIFQKYLNIPQATLQFIITESGSSPVIYNSLNHSEFDLAITLFKNQNGAYISSQFSSEPKSFEALFFSRNGSANGNIHTFHDGRYDFLNNPQLEIGKFTATIKSILRKQTKGPLENLNKKDQCALDALNGSSKAMREVRQLLRKVSKFPGVPVLITGETGKGKELVANALHYMSN